MSRFLRFVCILTGIIFVGNAFAAGYVCEDLRTYTSCGTGYYMTTSNNTSNFDANGSWCVPCSKADGVDTYCPGGIESPIYKLTLDQNGATTNATVTTLWFQSNPRRFCIDKTNCAGTVVAQLTGAQLPTKTGYKFLSYSNDANPGDGDMSISDTGMIDEFGDVDADYILHYPTWYAQWEKINPSESGCPAGQHVSADGTECLACPAGSYQPNDGNTATSCPPCGAGKWSTAGASSCQTITAGCYGTSADRACPSVCGADSYSAAGASSCTACATGYTNSGSAATDHADAASCKITCNAGQIVVLPYSGCINIGQMASNGSANYAVTGTGWFTSAHTVSYGEVSPVAYCPNGFTKSTGYTNQLEACQSDAVTAAGQSVNIGIPQNALIRFINLNGGKKVFRVFAYPSGVSIPTADVLDAVDGNFSEQNGFYVSSLSNAYMEFRALVPIDAVEFEFRNSGTVPGSTNYQIEISLDNGTSWKTIYISTNRKNDTSTVMQLSPATYKKKFVLYYERPAPAGSYALARDVILQDGHASLNNTKACARGAYTDTAGQSKCTPCQDGKTTSGVGQTSCNADCGKSNVKSWATASWSDNNKVSGVCEVNTCDSMYVKTTSSDNTACTACTCSPASVSGTCTVTGTSDDNQCQYSFTCNTGYQTVSGGTSGTYSGIVGQANNPLKTCNAQCTAVGLVPSNGNSPTTIYTKFGDTTSWYSENTCTTKISEIEKPVRDGYIWGGYYNQSLDPITSDISKLTSMLRIAPHTTDGNLLGGTSGKVVLPAPTGKIHSGSSSADKTWYAWWVAECESSPSAICTGPYYHTGTNGGQTNSFSYINCCRLGYNKDGMDIAENETTCPSGT